MPAGSQPIVNDSILKANQEGIKVWEARSVASIASEYWTRSRTLIPLSTTHTNGSSLGSCTFALYPTAFPGDPEYTIENESYTRYNAPSRHRVITDLPDYPNPLYVKITHDINGEDKPVWFGYIESVSFDIVTERSVAFGVSFAGLLDQVDCIGGYFALADDNIGYRAEVLPIFNRNGNGNKGGNVTSGSITAPCIDMSKEVDTRTARFTLYDVINHLLLLAVNPSTLLGTKKPYSFIEKLYQSGIISIASAAQTILSSSFPVDSYSYVGKPFWSALVELVESAGGLVITEKMPDGEDGLPIIRIAKVK